MDRGGHPIVYPQGEHTDDDEDVLNVADDPAANYATWRRQQQRAEQDVPRWPGGAAAAGSAAAGSAEANLQPRRPAFARLQHPGGFANPPPWLAQRAPTPPAGPPHLPLPAAAAGSTARGPALRTTRRPLGRASAR